MSYTMEDFQRQYAKDHFSRLTPQEQREALERLSPQQRRELLQSLPREDQENVLQSLPPEKRLAGLSVEQIQQYLDQLTAKRPTAPRKPRRKK